VKRDVIFYQLFQRFPNLFFDLIGRPQLQGYRFNSVEVKEPTFRIDGVFLPPENASPKLIFFVEVQMQKDEFLYNRFFAESMLYLHRNPIYDDWFGVVLLKSRRIEPKKHNPASIAVRRPSSPTHLSGRIRGSRRSIYWITIDPFNPGNSKTDAESGKTID
jgi:predicted transposase/invertase (TIGR01784 family)